MWPTVDLGWTKVPTYFIWISLTFSVCLFYLNSRARKKNFDERTVLDLFAVVSLGSLIGARLLHVFWEEWSYYYEDPFRILQLWSGGFIFYGGFLGGLLAGVVYLRIQHLLKSWKIYFDLFTPVISLGYAIGRWGCLAAGCCYGKFCDLPWAIEGRHPTPIYSSIWEFAVLFYLLRYEKKWQSQPGLLFHAWLGLHSLGRFWIEFFRGDFRGPESIFSISGWISLGFFLYSLWFLRRTLSPISK